MSDSIESLEPSGEPADTSSVDDSAPEIPSGSPPSAEEEPAAAGGEPVAAGAELAAATDKGRDAKAGKWRREPGLALAFRKGLPVEGTVEQVIRGGYEVRVGKARGFCPHSQMDVHHVEHPEEHVGRKLSFRVIQLRRGGEEVVLSRRALLDEARSEEAKAVRATLIEGHVTQGHVARLTDFGAFVDIGAGVTGLVHVSEISHARVVRPSDVLKPGDAVRVKVLSLGEEGRISLSIRQAVDDPWDRVAERFRAGGMATGVVKRLADFGAFVELEPGIEALAPADAFAPGPGGWSDGVETGQSRSWKIVSVDGPRRRISIQPSDDAEAAAPLEAGVKLSGRVQRVEKFGVFVWLRPGTVGLLPSVYTGTRKGTDLSRAFTPGSPIEVEVLEVSPDGRRVRLSVPGIAAQAQAAQERRPSDGPSRERERFDRPAEPREPPPPAASFGTSLGDKLRAAFDRKPQGS